MSSSYSTTFYLRGILCLILLSSFYGVSSQWVQSTGVQGGKVNFMLPKSAKLFAATDTGGVFVSNDNGGSWNTTNGTLPNHNITSLCVSGTKLIASVGNGMSTGCLFLSDDNGVTWKVPSTNYFGFVFCLSTYNTDIIAGTWYGMAFSADQGSSWPTATNTGLPSNAAVAALAVNGDTIYAGVSSSSTGGTGVFVSTNRGNNWTAKNSGLTNTVITSIATSATHKFVGTNGGGIFVSADKGNTWTAANNGLVNYKVNALLVNSNYIYAGTDDGIYVSSDNGATWKNINTGLPASTKVYSITVMANYMVIGTANSIWRRPIYQVSGISQVPIENNFTEIFPNPSKGSFEVSANTEVDFQLFDALGNIIESFMLNDNNGFQKKIEGLPQGIYYLREKGMVMGGKKIVIAN